MPDNNTILMYKEQLELLELYYKQHLESGIDLTKEYNQEKLKLQKQYNKALEAEYIKTYESITNAMKLFQDSTKDQRGLDLTIKSIDETVKGYEKLITIFDNIQNIKSDEKAKEREEKWDAEVKKYEEKRQELIDNYNAFDSDNYEDKKDAYSKFIKDIEALDDEYNENKIENDKAVSKELEAQYREAYSAMTDVLRAFEGENEKVAKAVIAMDQAMLAMDEAMIISQQIKILYNQIEGITAQASLRFPFNLYAMARTAAAMAASII